MRVEISIDCIDDTGRLPHGQIIEWQVNGEQSRDVRLRMVADVIVNALKENWTKKRDGTHLDGIREDRTADAAPQTVVDDESDDAVLLDAPTQAQLLERAIQHLCWDAMVMVEEEIGRICQRQSTLNRAEIVLTVIKMIAARWPDEQPRAEPSSSEKE
jgi:hypothetical protein